MNQEYYRIEREKSKLLRLIGGTPLLKVPKEIIGVSNVEIYAKAEWYNPGGSVKDRAALYMIIDGIEKGELTKEKTIIEATSGNTGVGESLVANHLGYKILIVAPENASLKKKEKMKEYGAEMEFTPKGGGTEKAIERVEEIISEHPEKYFFPNQYNNEANIKAHYEGTGPEILKEIYSIDAFVSVIGTGGTILGNAKRLKEHDSNIKIYGVVPDNEIHGFEGIKHLKSMGEPGNLSNNPGLIDEYSTISTDAAIDFAEYLVKQKYFFEGKIPGPSGLGNLIAAIEIAKHDFGNKTKGRIVTIFPDSMDNYEGNGEPWGEILKNDKRIS